MPELDFETDAFLELLTDALRAGPGSPAWHEALQRLRSGGIEGADEYRLLVTARERLESGRSYRSVRAGSGFTQRVMGAIDHEEKYGSPRSMTPTSLIAIGAAFVVLVVVLLVGYLLWTAAERAPNTPEGPTLLVNTVSFVDFTGELPSDWRMIGRLPLEFVKGSMRYAAPSSTTQPTQPTLPPAGANTIGGGVTWSKPIAPDEPFAFVVNVRVHHPEDSLIAQVFISDTPQFDDENATTSHELVWLLLGRQAQVVLPSGRVEGQTELPKDYKGNFVRVVVDHDEASVELSGKKFWSGSTGLDPSKPRFVGVRFLRKAPDATGDGVIFESVRVNTRQK
jgi:hypothetical protein